MTEQKSSTGWVYVYVGGQEGNETFLGLYNEDLKIDYIPAFASKEAAQDHYLSLPRAKGEKYEVQAVHIEELRRDAEDNGFVVALVDEDGKVCTLGDDANTCANH